MSSTCTILRRFKFFIFIILHFILSLSHAHKKARPSSPIRSPNNLKNINWQELISNQLDFEPKFVFDSPTVYILPHPRSHIILGPVYVAPSIRKRSPKFREIVVTVSEQFDRILGRCQTRKKRTYKASLDRPKKQPVKHQPNHEADQQQGLQLILVPSLVKRKCDEGHDLRPDHRYAVRRPSKPVRMSHVHETLI